MGVPVDFVQVSDTRLIMFFFLLQCCRSFAANGYTGQFSDFYENVGYKPKTDMGHDGQTFTPVYGGGLAEKTGRPQPAAPGEDINARPGFMMTGVFSGFHDSVGYKPLSDVGNDAQPFASVSETTAQS